MEGTVQEEMPVAGDKSVTVEGDPLEILDKAKQKIVEG